MTVSVASSTSLLRVRRREEEEEEGRGSSSWSPLPRACYPLYILLPSFLALSSHRSTYHHPRTPTTSALAHNHHHGITTTMMFFNQHIGTDRRPERTIVGSEKRRWRKRKKFRTKERRSEAGKITWEGEKEGTKKPRVIRGEMSKMEEQGGHV